MAADRYKSKISAYEVRNEPNGITFWNPVDPVAYTRILQTGYTAIKAADPSATVIGGDRSASPAAVPVQADVDVNADVTVTERKSTAVERDNEADDPGKTTAATEAVSAEDTPDVADSATPTPSDPADPSTEKGAATVSAKHDTERANRAGATKAANDDNGAVEDDQDTSDPKTKP